MNDILYFILSGASVIGVLVGIYFMSSVRTAVKGNLLGSICTAVAIIITLLKYNIVSNMLVWICMVGSLIIGFIWTYKVKMIQMPQLVALYNGFGGGASAIIALVTLLTTSGLDIGVFAKITAGIALSIGLITLIGSLIAAGKLHKIIGQHPLIFKGHTLFTIAMLALMVISIILVVVFDSTSLSSIVFLVIISSLFALAFTIRIGGADMPITISLLNSLSGVAGAIAGMAVDEPLLVAVGGIVGASGLLLTQVMCKSMNRSLMDILLGKTSIKKGPKSLSGNEVETRNQIHDSERKGEENYLEILKKAKKVIMIPGYGMALAQAQHLVKELSDKLETEGDRVSFAIHPVAGRMPGHMNVLLSEVNIPYDKLQELEDINPEFEDCDAVIIIGANDVINPVARTQEGTPIYGMPILDAYLAKHLIICNFDLQPGYAGVDNPLYTKKTGVSLLLGDAKESLTKIINNL